MRKCVVTHISVIYDFIRKPRSTTVATTQGGRSNAGNFLSVSSEDGAGLQMYDKLNVLYNHWSFQEQILWPIFD